MREINLYPILRRAQKILRSEAQWQLQYILREKNLTTNLLVKLSLTWKSELQILKLPPLEVLGVLNQDPICHDFLSLALI